MTDEFDDTQTPTPADLAAQERFYGLLDRYPTFALVWRVVRRHDRHKRLIQLNAPEFIIEKEGRMVQEAMDALVWAFPRNLKDDVISFPAVLRALENELEHELLKGDD